MNRKNNKIIIRVIVPVLIMCVIGVIWFLKNAPDDTVYVEPDNHDFSFYADETFDLERLKSYGLPIIIDIGNEFCSPCWEMKRILRELNEELQGKAIIVYIDNYEYKEVAAPFPISGIPTQFFYDSNGIAYNPENPNHPWMNQYYSLETGEPTYTAHKGLISKEELLEILLAMGMQQ